MKQFIWKPVSFSCQNKVTILSCSSYISCIYFCKHWLTIFFYLQDMHPWKIPYVFTNYKKFFHEINSNTPSYLNNKNLLNLNGLPTFVFYFDATKIYRQPFKFILKITKLATKCYSQLNYEFIILCNNQIKV